MTAARGKRSGPRAAAGRLLRRGIRAAVLGMLALVLLAVGWAALYRVVDPPVTPLMLIRWLQDGLPMERTPVGLDRISPHLVRAVIASEDSRFCLHDGFDVDAIRAALERNAEGGPLRGGSTISQQAAKNAFLWPDRTWVRKGMEAGFTVLAETFWGKRRIAEAYLDMVEWDEGVYGAEAAARRHFGKAAADLTRREAALLAVVLPNPRVFSASRPTAWVRQRASVIEARMRIVERDGLADCVLGPAGGPTPSRTASSASRDRGS